MACAAPSSARIYCLIRGLPPQPAAPWTSKCSLACSTTHSRQKTSAEILARLDAEDVPNAKVLSREEMLTSPQVMANELVLASEHPHAGFMREPRPAARFDVTPASIRRPAPALGEHTDEVLQEVGVEDIAALAGGRDPRLSAFFGAFA